MRSSRPEFCRPSRNVLATIPLDRIDSPESQPSSPTSLTDNRLVSPVTQDSLLTAKQHVQDHPEDTKPLCDVRLYAGVRIGAFVRRLAGAAVPVHQANLRGSCIDELSGSSQGGLPYLGFPRCSYPPRARYQHYNRTRNAGDSSIFQGLLRNALL